MSRKKTLAEFELEYGKILPAAERMRDCLKAHIECWVAKQGVRLAVPVEARVKSWDSVAAKLERGIPRLDKIEGMNDLVGLRTVVLFDRDLEPLNLLIERLFPGGKRNNLAEQLKCKEFAYRSVHHLVRLPPEFQGALELEGWTKLKAEIQVRTLAQHLWAAASHELQYKNEDSIPGIVQRPLFRVAALLEVVDLEFERVLVERDKYRQSGASEPDTAPLNVDNLEVILRAKLPPGVWIENPPLWEILEDLLYYQIDTRGKLIDLIDQFPPVQNEVARTADAPSASDEEPDQECYPYDDDIFEGDYSPGHVVCEMLISKFGTAKWDDYRRSRAIEAFKHLIL